MNLLKSARLTIIFLFIFLISSGVIASDQNASYEEGLKLIDNNCYDCYGATQKGLETGLLILESLAEKESNKKELFSYLAKAYRELALTYSSNGSSQQREFLDKEQAALSKALTIDPDDVDLKMRYIDGIADEEKYKELIKFVENNRSHAEAQYSLGMLLIYKHKNIPKGIEHIKKGYDLAVGEEKKIYGRVILEVLREFGQKQEHEEFLFIYTKDWLKTENSSNNSLKVLLNIENIEKPFNGDVPFLITFRNEGNRIIKIAEDDKFCQMLFNFQLIRDDGVRIDLSRNSKKLSGNNILYREIEGNGKTSIATSLRQIVPFSSKLRDGGYILYLFYSNKYGDADTFKGRIVSEPIKFNIINYIKNKKEELEHEVQSAEGINAMELEDNSLDEHIKLGSNESLTEQNTVTDKSNIIDISDREKVMGIEKSDMKLSPYYTYRDNLYGNIKEGFLSSPFFVKGETLFVDKSKAKLDKLEKNKEVISFVINAIKADVKLIDGTKVLVVNVNNNIYSVIFSNPTSSPDRLGADFSADVKVNMDTLELIDLIRGG